MEISPIPGIRSLPVVKTPRADADLSRVFDIVNSTRPDDDTYNGSSKKGPGGQDDEPETAQETVPAVDAQRTESAEETGTGPAVNYFA